MRTEELIIDCCYYCFQFENDNKSVLLESNHFGELLTVPHRLEVKHKGFYSNEQFICVVADEHTVTFTSDSEITMEMLEDWFRTNLSGIYDIGYEVLEREKV